MTVCLVGAENASKVCRLKQLRSLGRLTIFRADLSEEGSFDAAVSGCHYVFLVAAPVNMAAEDAEVGPQPLDHETAACLFAAHQFFISSSDFDVRMS